MFGPMGIVANISGVREWSGDERGDQQHSYKRDSFYFHDFSLMITVCCKEIIFEFSY
jgi:hypothetical protein